ncbi:DHH phosphoesterase [Daldinia caldariorum]|uniref:DHH phosphoesterase n=1 Tax=Daldinia caldariorum TaxID=326644 RepID=UPI00200837D8|nr:DHH phosphoesterase [Daldinia caldariorum]KAI1470703.1 DHH phosphoesterase [Daldinia caldariorum]
MPPPKTLQAFLATARAALTAPPSKGPKPLHFVVGNESADLDSLCSALFLAYIRTHSPPHTLHIPLCHLPRDDLSLRPEFAAVLKYAAVTPDDLLTLSELPPTGANGLEPEDTHWLLVDHNVMTGELGRRFGNRVVGCIDHHDDEGKVPADATPRVIEKCGSCMSLIVEQCGEAWEALAKREDDSSSSSSGNVNSNGNVNGSQDALRVNSQLAYLALAPILVDTLNLGNKDKTTAHDERAVEIAEAHVRAGSDEGGDGGGYDRGAFFAEVEALKEDVSYMSFRDIFRKDYKEWDVGGEGGSGLKLGTSSAPISFASLARKAGDEGKFAEELRRWCEEKDMDVMVLLTTSKDGDDDGGSGEFRRELLVWARGGERVVGAVKAFVENGGKEKLGLDTWGEGKLDLEDDKDGWRRCWTQAKVEYSRKQIAPMLREALKGVKKG